jgi:anti-sigma factor RsiW
MQNHPSEIELLEFAEGDLSGAEFASLKAHLAACEQCAVAVAELERARVILRSAPLLELPDERRRLMLERLPRQERERPALLALLSSPKRLALVAVPVAAAIAAVLTVTLTGGGGGERNAAKTSAATAFAAQAEAAPAETTAGGGGADTGAAATTAGTATAPQTKAPPNAGDSSAQATYKARGTAEEVAVQLDQKGVHVEQVLDKTVIVTGDPKDVESALDGRLTAETTENAVTVVVQAAGTHTDTGSSGG